MKIAHLFFAFFMITNGAYAMELPEDRPGENPLTDKMMEWPEGRPEKQLVDKIVDRITTIKWKNLIGLSAEEVNLLPLAVEEKSLINYVFDSVYQSNSYKETTLMHRMYMINRTLYVMERLKERIPPLQPTRQENIRIKIAIGYGSAISIPATAAFAAGFLFR